MRGERLRKDAGRPLTAQIALCFALCFVLTACADGGGQHKAFTGVAAEPLSAEADTGADMEPGTDAEPGEKGTPDGRAETEGAPQTADTQEEAAEEPLSITVSAAGDVTLGNHKDQEYWYSFRETYDQEGSGYFLANVKDIFEADDFTIVNLEGPLTLSEEFDEDRTYNMRGDPEYVQVLTDGSVEAVSMGNNHRLDYKEAGSRDTVNALNDAGIVYAYDGNVGVYDAGGIRIGIVSVNESSQGTYVERYLQDGISRLKEEGASLILACCHWGTEKEYTPEEYQTELGRKCIDWGADLVIGHHPHVLQGIDYYQGKYIVYSLANFCFGGNRNPEDKDTMIFQQTFTFPEGGAAVPGEARVIPCSVSSVTSRNNFQPTPLAGEEYERVIGRLNEFSSGFDVTIGEDGVIAHVEG